MKRKRIQVNEALIDINIVHTGSNPSSERVTMNNIYDLESKLTGVEYVISAAIASDTGTYQCKANNKVNVVTKQINVSVTSGPGMKNDR